LCVARSLSGRMRIEGVSPAWLCGGLPPCLTLQWGTQALPDWLSIGLTYLDNELRSEHLARQAVIDRLGDILFIQSLRVYLSGPSQAPTGWLMGLKDGMISRVLGAIHREPDRPWQLAELAKVGCVSRSVLAARFTQVLGVPPQAYLTQHRMHLAAKYLQDTAVPVLEVARLQAGHGLLTHGLPSPPGHHGLSPALADGSRGVATTPDVFFRHGFMRAVLHHFDVLAVQLTIMGCRVQVAR